MGEFTSEHVQETAKILAEKSYSWTNAQGVAMLHAYAALLERQAQWPNDDAMRIVANKCANDELAWSAWLKLHAALLERRAQWPSEEDVERACRGICAYKGFSADELTQLARNRNGILSPFWMTYESEVRAALQAVAPVQASAVPEVLSSLYAAARKGFHTSETCGPESRYVHISKFQTLQDLFDYEDAWRKAMLAAAPQTPKEVQP